MRYRIRKDTYTSGTLTEARHYYYTPGWQCVEERVGTSTTAERQFVWGLRYIDDLVLRDRSTANNGVINERRYAMQDGNWNTIAICDTTGSVGERYAYSAYGTPVFMTGAGVVQATSAIGFETLYAGYRFDGTTPQMYYVRGIKMSFIWHRPVFDFGHGTHETKLSGRGGVPRSQPRVARITISEKPEDYAAFMRVVTETWEIVPLPTMPWWQCQITGILLSGLKPAIRSASSSVGSLSCTRCVGMLTTKLAARGTCIRGVSSRFGSNPTHVC